MSNTVGILLAGGRSSRYGSPKAFASIKGEFFHEKAYRVLQAVCDEVVVVTRNELLAKFPAHYHLLTDTVQFAGCGPLAGIYTAMEAIEAKQYVVLPCDMPLINDEIMRQLLQIHKQEITVIEVNGRTQPLVSVWNRSVKDRMKDSLQKGQFRLQDVFDKSSIMEVASATLTNHIEIFMNVNTPEQDKEMRRWLKF